MKITDTIAAISSAAGNSGIGIIRVSGDEAIEVVDKIFRPANKNKKLANVESHTVHYGHIMDGDKTLDQVLVIVMKNPHSYTGEDTVEIDCHGGMLILKKVLDLVLKNGANKSTKPLRSNPQGLSIPALIYIPSVFIIPCVQSTRPFTQAKIPTAEAAISSLPRSSRSFFISSWLYAGLVVVVSVVVAFAFAKAVCSTWFIFSDTSIIFPELSTALGATAVAVTPLVVTASAQAENDKPKIISRLHIRKMLIFFISTSLRIKPQSQMLPQKEHRRLPIAICRRCVHAHPHFRHPVQS